MATTSLLVVGNDTTVIGRFGMGVDEARKKFEGMCENLQCKPDSITTEKDGTIKFNFYNKKEDTIPDNMGKLIERLANCPGDIHDPPTMYILSLDENVKDGEYMPVGQFKG